MAEGGGRVGRTVRRSRLPSGCRACHPSLFNCQGPWHWDLALARVLAALAAQERAIHSNSGVSDAAVLSPPAGLPGVSVLSGSAMTKYYQLQRVPRDER